MTSVANILQTLSLEKIYHLLDLAKVRHALSVLDVFEKEEVESKLVFRVLRARVLKQATRTRDGSQSFHNVSTKVSSVTCMYKDSECVSVCIPVAFFYTLATLF